jgi:hypothetical protein
MNRSQEMTRVYGVMTCLLLVVVCQVVLLAVAMESFWRGETRVLFAATVASGAAFAGATWVIRYILPREGRNSH